ncbi:hypothetical protein J6590_084821 [Homalodisca vitripennis]|nr:hypothetical protein J6590_084821 [Homalodisca vitripennis]
MKKLCNILAVLIIDETYSRGFLNHISHQTACTNSHHTTFLARKTFLALRSSTRFSTSVSSHPPTDPIQEGVIRRLTARQRRTIECQTGQWEYSSDLISRSRPQLNAAYLLFY